MSTIELTEEWVDIKLINGVEGLCIAINDNRIAGPKPWGGGAVMESWRARRDDIARAIGFGEQTKTNEAE